MTATDDGPGASAPPEIPDPATPQDIIAEQCALGLMMLSKDAIADAVPTLRAGDFARREHGIIYEAILELYGRTEPADPAMVAHFLAERDDLQRIGGAPYLHTLISVVPVRASVVHYAQLVADKALRRRLGEAGYRIMRLVDPSSTIATPDAVDLAQQALYDLTADGRDTVMLPEMLVEVLDSIEASTGDSPPFLSTGFQDLDRLLSGLRPGQLVVIGGRPGIGKSAVGLSILRHVVFRLGCPGVLFTREMPEMEVATRILSAETEVPLHVLRAGLLTDAEWTSLARGIQAASESPLFIDAAVTTVDELRAKARRLRTRHSIGLIVVDYLQMFVKGRNDRYREVSDVSRALKDLSLELDIPVVVMSQLNRLVEQRTDKRPQLIDLRDSGTIEDDADVVILVHRDDYYDQGSSRPGECDLIVAKHRSGPIATVTVAAELHYARMLDLDG
ncbi:replicative DNA helicase [Dactylosporangium sp. NPDC051485]|uniref:replicative DNA helicase n=1 Tax=Dactylosporangium sp. NPDC051485 TaxID=3154846 RepID=UPI00343E56B0